VSDALAEDRRRAIVPKLKKKDTLTWSYFGIVLVRKVFFIKSNYYTSHISKNLDWGSILPAKY
jgi:hypothetical protein